MRYLLLTLAFAGSLAVGADDDLRPVPAIHLPMTPVLVQPDEPVQPSRFPISVLTKGALYVVESSTSLIALQSPEGFLNIVTAKGPMSVYGLFADGGPNPELRTYSSENILIVTGIKSGKTELLLIPVGVVEAKDIVRQVLTVSGEGPKPPPDVDPPPDVEPEPPKPPTGIRVLLLYNENANRQQLNTVNSTQIVDWMTANCATSADGRPEWRRWDRTSVSKPDMLAKETLVWQKLWSEVGPTLPPGNFVVVVTDTSVTPIPMGGPDEMLAAMKKIKEGK